MCNHPSEPGFVKLYYCEIKLCKVTLLAAGIVMCDIGQKISYAKLHYLLLV